MASWVSRIVDEEEKLLSFWIAKSNLFAIELPVDVDAVKEIWYLAENATEFNATGNNILFHVLDLYQGLASHNRYYIAYYMQYENIVALKLWNDIRKHWPIRKQLVECYASRKSILLDLQCKVYTVLTLFLIQF